MPPADEHHAFKILIPVLALTSSTAADANKLTAAGCIGFFIPKPFDAKTLTGRRFIQQ
jgi:hypothetical protein